MKLSHNFYRREDVVVKGIKSAKRGIIKNPRIGVDYAGADALLPYRFVTEF